MTLEERIEAMVAEMVRRPEVGDDIGEALWRGAQSVARQYLAAAFPELFASPPEAWLAPWDVTLTMLPAAQAVYPGPVASFERWSAMRDAHLNPEDKSP